MIPPSSPASITPKREILLGKRKAPWDDGSSRKKHRVEPPICYRSSSSACRSPDSSSQASSCSESSSPASSSLVICSNLVSSPASSPGPSSPAFSPSKRNGSSTTNVGLSEMEESQFNTSPRQRPYTSPQQGSATSTQQGQSTRNVAICSRCCSPFEEAQLSSQEGPSKKDVATSPMLAQQGPGPSTKDVALSPFNMSAQLPEVSQFHNCPKMESRWRLPRGWTRIVKVRQSGKTVGCLDIYFCSPDRKKIRSKRELLSYFRVDHPDITMLDLKNFIFSKVCNCVLEGNSTSSSFC